jgi:putative FmdB family regulatory protein
VPTYQYACTACGHQLEAVQSFTDPALTQCPVCDGRLRKLFSAVGIVFKGSGFYRTDSRSGSTTESGGSSKDAKDGGSKETKTTEAKPSTDSSSSTPASTSSSSSSANGSSGGSSSSGSSSGAKAATAT